jgi:hypothetical protein
MKPTALLVLLLVGGCTARDVRSADGVSLLKEVQVVPLPGVEGRFDHFAVDLPRQRLFVAALGNNTVEEIDLRDGRVARTVRGLREPQGLAVAPELGRLFVGVGEGAACEVFETATLNRIATVPQLPDADNVRFDPERKRAYVGYDGGLAIIDAAAGKLVARVPLPSHAESFQLEKNGPRIFINLPGSSEVAVVDRDRQAVTAHWPVRGAGANFPMALDEPSRRLFLGCRRPARLLAYDSAMGREVASTEVVEDTDDLFYDANRKRIYVIGGGGAVTVLAQRSPDRYERVGQISTATGARTGFFVPALDRLFVAVPHRAGKAAEIRVFQPRD